MNNNEDPNLILGIAVFCMQARYFFLDKDAIQNDLWKTKQIPLTLRLYQE